MVGIVVDFQVWSESKKESFLKATVLNDKGERRTFNFKLHETPFFIDLYENPAKVQVIATDTEGFSVVCRYSN